MNLHVYLNFDGNTEEAIYFYQKALKLAEPNILRFGDLPKSENMPFDYDAVKHLVLHSELVIGSSTIMFSDAMPGMPLAVGNNMSVTIIFDTLEEITEAFNNLSVGGQIIMPLAPTMWAESYAYFIDKFGTPWQLSYHGNVKFSEA